MSDPEQAAAERREQSRSRLRDRILDAVSSAVANSAFLKDNPAVRRHCKVQVDHNGAWVNIRVFVPNDAIQLIPFTGRIPSLDGFLNEIDPAVKHLSEKYRLPLRDMSAFPASGYTILTTPEGDLHTGKAWILEVPNG